MKAFNIYQYKINIRKNLVPSVNTHEKSYIYASSYIQNLLFNFSGFNKYIQKRFIILIIHVCYAVMYLVKRFDKEV